MINEINQRLTATSRTNGLNQRLKA